MDEKRDTVEMKIIKNPFKTKLCVCYDIFGAMIHARTCAIVTMKKKT